MALLLGTATLVWMKISKCIAGTRRLRVDVRFWVLGLMIVPLDTRKLL